MDINKLALELQQNQSVRQKIYAQYMNNQDDFFLSEFSWHTGRKSLV